MQIVSMNIAVFASKTLVALCMQITHIILWWGCLCPGQVWRMVIYTYLNAIRSAKTQIGTYPETSGESTWT